VTLIDGLLAVAVLLGLILNAALGWWWADPVAGYVLVVYALCELREIFLRDIETAANTTAPPTQK
jgi:divalent metal cation (Fe/Co/Zn/Cd) transporter